MSEISFLGDLMFGDAPITFGYGVYSTWSKKDYKGIFEGVSSVLNSSDFVVANFEAMIRTNITDKNIYSWSMCCEKNVCQELINNNIKICSVANNHTYDHKEEGFKETVENL